MKVQSRVLDVTNTLKGENVRMSIDQSALSHIMSVLTDLYSDPELAVIREYSTNAYDAHVDAGINRPIEVQLPTPLSPYLRIRDYGEGLNAADIRDIYSRYGTSTKRGSNDVVGMLGLGCKSALTYTDQFTLSGIKNGVCVQVSVSRDEDGSGSMTLVSNHETDEESGVEVIIPAKSGNYFEQKAEQFFSFWEPGSVLVNGKAPSRIDGLWIADDLLLNTDIDENYVVMGNVAYPMDIDVQNRFHKVVAFVPIGAVNFTPSRESLQMNSTTRKTLEHLAGRVIRERDAALKKMVSEAPTYVEAIRLTNKARQMGLQSVPDYKGEPVPDRFNFINEWTEDVQQPDGTWAKVVHKQPVEAVVVNAVKSTYNRDKGWSAANHVPSTMIDSVWVEGYDSDQFTPYKRQKLEKFCEGKGIKRVGKPGYGEKPDPSGVTTFIFCRELPHENRHWIDPKRIIQWADIKAVKIEKEKRSTREDGRPTGSYDAFVDGNSVGGIPAGELDTKKLFWVHSSVRTQYGYHTPPRDLKILLAEVPGATVVTLQENRIAKFCRDFPQAQNMREFLTARAKAWEASVSKEDREAYVIQHSYDWSSFLKSIDPTQIDDPELERLATLARKRIQGVESGVARWKGFVQLSTAKQKGFETVTDKYPLLGYLTRAGGRAMNDVYLYLNAAYAARKEG